MALRNTKIHIKLIMISSAAVLGLAIVSILGFFGMGIQKQNIELIVEERIREYKEVKDISADIQSIQANLLGLIQWSSSGYYDQERLDEIIVEQRAEMLRIGETISAIRENIESYSPEEREFYSRMYDLYWQYIEEEGDSQREVKGYMYFAEIVLDMYSISPSYAITMLTTANQKYVELDEAVNRLILIKDEQINEGYRSSQESYSSISLVFGCAIVFALVISLVTSLIISRDILRPIKKASSSLENIASGVLTDEIEVSRRDEMGIILRNIQVVQTFLSKVLKDLDRSIQNSINISEDLSFTTKGSSQALTQMEEVVRNVKNKSHQLSESVSHSRELSHTVSSEADNLKNLTQQQYADVNLSSRSIEEISSSIAEISHTTDSKKAVVDQLLSKAEMGETLMSETISIFKKVTDSAEVIRSLLTMINKISAQTNLLAMNAAIEAAHAGDSGRGFSVVASEIRTLAEDAAAQSKDMQEALKKVIEYIGISSDSADNTGHIFKEIVEEVKDVSGGIAEIKASMDELSSNSRNIEKSLSQLVDITDDIKKSSDQVDIKVEEISKRFGEMSSFAMDTDDGMTGINSNIVEVVEQLKTMESSGEKNRHNIDILQNIMREFTL